MSFCCNYDIIEKNNGLQKIRKVSCFSSHYSKLQNNSEITIYILKDYKKVSPAIGNYNNCKFTKEEIEKYSYYLQRGGFNFELSETIIALGGGIYDLEKKGNEVDCYAFKIPIKENTTHGAKVLINLVRHLYEQNLVNFVTPFLQLMKEDAPDVTILERLIMSLYCYTGQYHIGHTFKNQSVIKLDNIFKSIFDPKQDSPYTALPCKNGVLCQNAHEIMANKELTLSEKKQKFYKL